MHLREALGGGLRAGFDRRHRLGTASMSATMIILSTAFRQRAIPDRPARQ